MAVYAFQVNKSHLWHGGREDIGNLYHYDVGQAELTDDYLEYLRVSIVNREALLFPAEVEFENVVVYGPTDGPEYDNVIIATLGCSETGGVTASQGASQTSTAVYVAWPLPRTETLNRRRRLGKFIRPAYGAVNDDGALSGRTAIPQDAQDYIRTSYATELTTIAGPDAQEAYLCTDDGVRPSRGPYVKNHVTNRQFVK